MIKVMLCDDMNEIRQYFEWVINGQSDMEVIATARSGAEAVNKAMECKPDIILMDVQMNDARDGIDATKQITKCLPDTKVIMLTIHNDDDFLIDSYVAGAVDYMIKETEVDVICDTIRSAYSNKYFVGSVIAQTVKEKFNRERSYELSVMYFINNMSRLTNAEWRILKFLYDGKKRKDIAEAEVLSEETVKFHIRNILKKLNFASSAEMVRFLKELGIFEKFNL